MKWVVTGFVVLLSGCTTLGTNTFSDTAGAIRGYDPVAYHTEMKPVKGNSLYTFEYNDATWHFASSRNLELFREDPGRYAPQYGGYCAYAMSRGFVVSTDPLAWTIDDEKLYLNYSLNVRRTWLKDVPGYVAKADVHWQKKNSQPVFE